MNIHLISASSVANRRLKKVKRKSHAIHEYLCESLEMRSHKTDKWANDRNWIECSHTILRNTILLPNRIGIMSCFCKLLLLCYDTPYRVKHSAIRKFSFIYFTSFRKYKTVNNVICLSYICTGYANNTFVAWARKLCLLCVAMWWMYVCLCAI